MGTSPNFNPQPTSPVDPSPLAGLQPSAPAGLTPVEEQLIQANEIALDQANFPGIQIKGVLGGLPVAEQNQEYFAVVFEAVDTTPEIIDQTQFKITYLCDSQLNVSKPGDDTIALLNTVQNFERQKIARVRVDQGTVLNNQLGGRHEITAVGSLEPICGTQIGQGPLSYVTTMSFKQADQLGPDLSRPVEGYYQWLQKTTGYQNRRIAFSKTGTTNQGDAWSLPATTTEGTLHTYFDSVQAQPSGSAVDAENSQSLFPTNYLDVINILTGSLDGNSRVKVKVQASINIATSSVADMSIGVLQSLNVDLTNGTNTSDSNQDLYSAVSNAPVTLNVYKETVSGGYNNRELLGSQTIALPTINDALVGPGSLDTIVNYHKFAHDALNLINNFSWNLNNSARFFSVETDYFDVEFGDHVYGEIVVPEEQEAPILGPIGSIEKFVQHGAFLGGYDIESSFTESLQVHRNQAALRSYQYFAGNSIMTQETPEEDGRFANNITGITASYFTQEGSASVYNYTGSYFVGFNNFSNSDEGLGSFITASTPLTNFYGGDFIQINPGTEAYNILNADSSPTSSLFANGLDAEDKLTWNNFGFNPIQQPFIPKTGDFIRFEFSKQKVYLITGVNSSGNALKLKLDGHIPASTVLDNFVIYRIVEDGQYIILNVKKNNETGVGQPFSGIISAEFPSEGLEERSDQLIFDLKQAGILSERDYLR